MSALIAYLENAAVPFFQFLGNFKTGARPSLAKGEKEKLRFSFQEAENPSLHAAKTITPTPIPDG
ncbi:MAG: hypothetical protein ACUVTH_01070 [Thermogutta sp.]